MNHQRIAALLISAATAVAMQPAGAADIPVKAAAALPPAIASGFFGYIEGMYVFEPGSRARQYPNLLPLASGPAGPGDGLGGAFLIGYRFAGPWDVSFGMHHTRFRDGDRQLFPACGGTFTQMTDPHITSVDGSIGYNISTAESATRIHAGVRYAQWKHHLVSTCNGLQNHAETTGIGPRAGFDHSIKLGGAFSLIMGGDASVLFADVEDRVTTFPVGAAVATVKNDRAVVQAGAHLALGWNVTPLLNLAAGYKIDQWFGMISQQMGFSPATVGGGRHNVTEHGPFVRASYNFGVK
jgi:hypothetical protein